MYVEVDWDRTATKNGFIRLYFGSKDELRLEKESVRVGEHARASGECSITVALVTLLVFFQDDGGRADISAIHRDCDNYRGLTLILEPASGAYLDTLFDQDLL